MIWEIAVTKLNMKYPHGCVIAIISIHLYIPIETTVARIR